MKHFFFWSITLLALASCSDKDTVKIKGEIKEGGKQVVYLDRVNVDDIITVDSAKLGSNGRFSFQLEAKEPTFYRLRVGKNHPVTFVAEPNKDINITGTWNKFHENYDIEGSESSALIKSFAAELRKTQSKLESLRKSYDALPQEKKFDTERKALEAEWDSTFVNQVRYSRNFIIENALSPASYYVLYQKINNANFILSPDTDLQSYRIVATSMSTLYPESQYTKALLAHHDRIMKQRGNQKMRELIVNSENNLPEISLPNVKGDTIDLSSLRGKYILLDFTVLSAEGCEAYIKELKKIYNQFKGKGLEIYQVCLDPNKLLWEELVRKYDIKWICVHDGANVRSRAAAVWNIQNIPANYIINRQYEIAGKNLTGRRLEERLNVIIK
ncbi:TlpA disulfide reductase family protein [Odoribacter lunatus]|uniref:TlpA disulfide reductase family protein n=1 Tax=Odoribacter lunatus TaxID=2941335 RepID=UPI002040E49B|nr:TlpA disulfide reductase family protein [Odoribacter lunatus]